MRTCGKCKLLVQKIDMPDHEQIYESRKLQCVAPACGFVVLKRELFEHAHNAHERDILDFIKRCTSFIQTDTHTTDASTQTSVPKVKRISCITVTDHYHLHSHVQLFGVIAVVLVVSRGGVVHLKVIIVLIA